MSGLRHQRESARCPNISCPRRFESKGICLMTLFAHRFRCAFGDVGFRFGWVFFFAGCQPKAAETTPLA